MTHICPVCGNETIETECREDSDGADIYIRYFTFVDITEQTCSCDLTDEQQEAICAADTCEPDEPDYWRED